MRLEQNFNRRLTTLRSLHWSETESDGDHPGWGTAGEGVLTPPGHAGGGASFRHGEPQPEKQYDTRGQRDRKAAAATRSWAVLVTNAEGGLSRNDPGRWHRDSADGEAGGGERPAGIHQKGSQGAEVTHALQKWATRELGGATRSPPAACGEHYRKWGAGGGPGTAVGYQPLNPLNF